jgi:hypothetical protein
LRGLERGDRRFKEALAFIDEKVWDENLDETDDFEYPKWRKLFLDPMIKFEEKEQDDIPF